MKKLVKSLMNINCAALMLINLAGCTFSANLQNEKPVANQQETQEEQENPQNKNDEQPSSVIQENPEKGIVRTVGENQKYTTLSSAIKDAKNGDVIMIDSQTINLGTTETININKSITLKGLENVKIDASQVKVNGDSSIITITAPYVTLDNLEICGLTEKSNNDKNHPCGIRVEAGANNIKIINCKIHDIGYKTYPKGSDPDSHYNGHGIWIGSQKKGGAEINGVYIYNCEIYNLKIGNSESLVLNGNVTNFQIINNYIHDCDNIGIDIIGYEAGNFSSTNRARNGLIKGNIVKNISSKNNYTYKDCCAGGIYVDGGTDVEIQNNLIIDCDIGIEVASEHEGYATNDIRVHNNIIYNSNTNSWAGISMGGAGIENGEATACKIINNTVFCKGNGESGSAFVIQKANDADNIIKNNIFITTKNYEPIEYASEDLDDYDNQTLNQVIDNDEFIVNDKDIKSFEVDEKHGTLKLPSSLKVTAGRGAGDNIF